MPTVQPPRGMRDFLPAEKQRREAVLHVIREAFASFGYSEIETPAVEEVGRLETADAGENQKLIYRILRRGLDREAEVRVAEAADLGLRFDLTLPLARFYASHRNELPAVVRAIQIGPVWRAERPQRGRYRQFVQCDIDVLGERSHLAEVELIVAVSTALQHLGIAGATVRLNDRRVLRGMLQACGFPPGAFGRALITVDKLDKVGLAGVEAELEDGGHPADAVKRLVEILATLGDSEAAALEVLERTAPADVAAELRGILADVGVAMPSLHVVADLTLVRGMGYYTGPIYEIRHPAAAGSIAGGGRYDGMIGRFLGEQVPACGLSIGFERIVDLIDPSAISQRRRAVALVYEAGEEPGGLVALQRELIAEGYAVRLVEQPKRLGRLLEALAAEGFSAFALVPRAQALRASIDLRPLTPKAAEE